MVTSKPMGRLMSRKSTLAIAAMAALGLSTFIATDADARGAGGHGFRGGGHSRSFHSHGYGHRYGHGYGHRYDHSFYGHRRFRGGYYGRSLHGYGPGHGDCSTVACRWPFRKPPSSERPRFPHAQPGWHHPGWHRPGRHRPYGWRYRLRAYGYGGTIMTAGGGGSSGGDATGARGRCTVARSCAGRRNPEQLLRLSAAG
jgi:hypothetical protein